MTNRKYTMITLIGMITLLIMFIYNFTVAPTKAYADNISEAQVTTNTTEQTANVTQVTTQKAPVSIAVYSNEVTESSDTYSYSVAANTSEQTTVVSSTPVPATDTTTNVTTDTTTNTNTVVATKDPQSTASPEATPEPDIITYPPTVAPAYTD